MSDPSTAVSPSVIAFLLGIISCIVLHARPIRSDRALCLEFAVFVALCCTNPNHLSSPLRSSLIRALFLIAIHAFTLCSVTVLYRISPLHPLWRFPGPFVHKFTSLYSAYKTYTGERPFYIDGLHKCYGPVVRIGPNFLSINSFDALAPIYGATSTMMKSAAYTFGGARGSGLFFMKDREEHGVRRKIWAPAFSQAILRPFRDVMARRTEQFIHILETRCGSQGFVDIGNVISLFTYDVMGDITFGSSSQADMLERGDPENLIKSGQMATMAFEIIGEVPALFSIAWYLPLSRKMRALEERAGKWMAARRDAGTTAMRQKDIASFLLAPEGTPQALSDADLRVDSLFAIQAGSDTPAGILTFMYFFLISNSTVYAALRDELDGRIQTSSRETLDVQTLVQLPYLSAFLTESLRLGTPFHGFPRVVPARGAIIAGEFIPGGTTVSVPGWSQHIDEANFFPDPHAFRPQRWLPGGLGPGSRANKAAVIAFSSGPFACLGKQLAIEELSINFARTILALDLSFAPGFDPVAFWDGVRNIRTPVFTRPLMVIVKRRRVNIA